MSILIKGMKMPKDCIDCHFLWFNDRTGTSNAGLCDIVETWIEDGFTRPDWCPLVEVTTPHGRLIDADALRDGMYHEAFETDSELQRWDSGCWVRYKMFENHMDNAPIIIEAEE